MTVTISHIDKQVAPKWLALLLSSVSFLPILKRFFSWQFWKAKFIGYLIREFKAINIISEKFLTELQHEEFSEENHAELVQSHSIVEKMHLKYRAIVADLERIDFFDNKELMTICEETIANFYKCESIVRNKAYANSKVIESEELSDFTSALSLGSLS